jgi:L-alanine-DL-glutamate epimerase-like enolase superfamily enzyme
VAAYRVELPFASGAYGVSGGRSSSGFDAVVVAVHASDRTVGWGEAAPLGSTYDPAFAAGARAALDELAQALLGEDPRQPDRVARALEASLRGHPYAKSALDMACWDAAGKAAGRPLCELLGGRFGGSVPLYRSIPPADPQTMAEAARAHVAGGYRRIQVKVGDDPDTDLERVAAVRAAVGSAVVLYVDANGGWTTAQARRFLLGLRDEAVFVEQPCRTLEECAALRPHCRHPLVLDESIDSLRALLRAHELGAVDGVTVKLARVGGITPARLIRDVAVALRIPVTVEDTGGSEIDTAAMAHLSLSTPETLRMHTVDWPAWITVSTATGLPQPRDGRLDTPAGPGLGVIPRPEALGEPFFELEL